MPDCRRFRISAIKAVLLLAGGILVGVVCPSNLAWAGIGFQPVNPAELKMTSEPLAPGAPAIILYRQVDRDDDRYHPHQENYLRVKILTEEGRNRAIVEIVFSKGYEAIEGIQARTIKPDGSIVEFHGQVFEKTILRRRGQDYYLAKTFTLPDVEVGSILEYFYTISFKEYYVFESHWILSEDLFTKDAKFFLTPYRSPYNEFHLRWTWQGLPAGSDPKQGGAAGIVSMDAHDIPAFQREDFMPPENELKARVDFIYDREIPEQDPDKYWQHLGKKRNDALESFVGKRKDMEEAVAQIVSPSDAPEVKLRKIYDRVQQIRNLSYEVRKTEQEEKRDKEKPVTNVAEIWKRGYGYGQQLTWLYLALVRAAGFEAYGCWVSDRSNYFFETKTMQGQKLNANVVLVKQNGKALYFDPGAAFTPFGLLTWSETGVRGLRLDKDGGTWIETTLPDASESQIRRQGKLQLSDAGDLEGELTVTYTGLEAMYRRLRERHEDEAARKKYAEDSLKEQIPAAAELELTNKPDWESAEAPLVEVLNIKIPGWASSAGKRVTLPVGFFTAREKNIFEHATRIHPIYFEYPYEKIDDLTVKLPEGWQVSTVPPPHKQDAKLIIYDLKIDSTGSEVHLLRKFGLNLIYVASDKYLPLRNFFQLIRNGDEEQILLQPGTVSSRN